MIEMHEYRDIVERTLQELYFAEGPEDELCQAMRYSLLAGGKRLRGMLVLAACSILSQVMRML